MKIILFLVGASALTCCSGYVLLQVRKGTNQSNVDAFIHKVVPSVKAEKIATARKQLEAYNKFDMKKANRDDGKLESIVIAIDSGITDNDDGSRAYNRIIQKISSFLQVGAMKYLPHYRSKLEKLHIKPEIVHFKSGKPSVMFEVDTKGIVKSIQEFLSSNTAKKYVDKVARQAAIIYRTVKKEMMKDD